MQVQEFPLVLFTLLTQMAVGLALLSVARQWAVAEGPGSRVRAEWVAVLALLVLGVAAAFTHLGHPLGFARMVLNVKTAWLSREILAMGVFGLLAAATVALPAGSSLRDRLMKATAAVGVLALLATGMTYAVPSAPALSSGLPVLFFVLTALVLGTATAAYFAPADKQALLARVLMGALLLSLVVSVAVPLLWLAGGRLSAASGEAFLASPLFWVRIVLLALAPVVLWRAGKIPAWLPPVLVVGELAGRMLLLGAVATSAANLGMPY